MRSWSTTASPDHAINELARVINPLRAAIVATEQSGDQRGDDMHFCPCCSTPRPTDADMEACHQHCLDKRQADTHAAQNQPDIDPRKK